MKDTEYLGYTLHTVLFEGIEIVKNDEVVYTCDTLEQAVIWIEETLKENNSIKNIEKEKT